MKQAKWIVAGVAVMALVGGVSGTQQSGVAKAMSEASAESSKPSLVMSKEDNYHIYKHKGRLYVIDCSEMSKQFAEQGHLPYTHTIIGAAPMRAAAS